MATGIERLYDYTRFHVGLYGSLVFGAVALIGIGDGVALRDPSVVKAAAVAVFCWVLAGFSGGVILGTLVEFEGDLSEFRDKDFGPGEKEWMKGASWEALEHVSFWIGTVFALIAFGLALWVVL